MVGEWEVQVRLRFARGWSNNESDVFSNSVDFILGAVATINHF